MMNTGSLSRSGAGQSGDHHSYFRHFYNIDFFPFRVCQLHYSHILHFENFHLEWKQFVADIKLEEELELPWENKGVGSLMSYYDLITPEEKIKLYGKYRPDFLMFGYSVEDDF